MPLFDTWWKIAILIGALALLRVGAHFSHFLGQKIRKNTIEFLDSALIALVVVFCVIRPFFIQAYFIPSVSMYPTLHKGDRILVNKLIYRLREPRRGEVVVFRAPPLASRENRDFIKRLIALSSDNLEVKYDKSNGETRVFLNGRALKESYIAEPMTYQYPKTRIPPGRLFVMGDNRNDSNDSHRWGFLPRANLEGKALLIFWPPSRMGLVH